MADFTILEGDCLAALRTVPDDSVNLIVTSPPYGNQRKATYGGIDPDKYSEWFIPRAAEFMRVLAPDGSLVLNIKEHCEDGERHTYVLRLILALKDAGWLWIEEYMWRKPNAMPGNFGVRLRDAWERLLHFSRSSQPMIYKDAVRVPIAKSWQPNVYNSNYRKRRNGSGFRTRDAYWYDKDEVYPDNVIEAALNREVGAYHSAVFPAAIPEFFIKLFTLPGDTVLDPFAGSGTTLFAAYEMDRRAIGCEIMPEYCQAIRKRKAQTTMRLPGLETI